MFIFLGAIQSIAIPESQIVNIQASGSKINIIYNYGTNPQEEATFTINYSSEKAAQNVMKDFYAACIEGKNAYFFGNIKEFINS